MLFNIKSVIKHALSQISGVLSQNCAQKAPHVIAYVRKAQTAERYKTFVRLLMQNDILFLPATFSAKGALYM